MVGINPELLSFLLGNNPKLIHTGNLTPQMGGVGNFLPSLLRDRPSQTIYGNPMGEQPNPMLVNPLQEQMGRQHTGNPIEDILTHNLFANQPTGEGKVGKPTKEFGFTDQGLYEQVVDFPMEEIPKRSITTPEYRDADVVATKGKKVTKPIIATIENINDPNSPIEIVDGWHRYRQSLANGDKTIPVKLIYNPKLSQPTGKKNK